jgi:hypothetical protein
MLAALQQPQGTMTARTDMRPLNSGRAPPANAAMPTASPRRYKIQGITREGKAFRPSDWAERLAGALSSFQPLGSGIGAHIGYSPYCIPRVVGGVKCVIVSEALRTMEPMALDFVLHFARDNSLVITEIGPDEDLS